MKVRIVSGWSNPGGSTIHHINLTNLLNANGYDCTFYGPHDWHMDKCKADHINRFYTTKEDILISHFIQLPTMPAKKHILSCHETNLFPLNQVDLSTYDLIQYVSEFQREWHGVDHPYHIIPGIIDKIKWNNPNNKIAGVIGSIDEHKQTHVSIQRALQDGYHRVYLYGQINDKLYFDEYVYPLLSNKVIIKNYCNNKEEMYNSIEAVYHSSKRECLPTIQGECLYAGIPYFGLECNMRNLEDYEFDDKEILRKWEAILNL